MTLYELLGDEAVSAVVNEFYDRMIQDHRVNHHFLGKDTNKLRMHQMYFLVTYALEGPQVYNGRKLSHAHQGMNITDEEYEITIRHMMGALRKFDVPLEIRAKLEAFMRGIKPHVVYK